ncbi:MAG TPA: hypothetical protein VFX16_36745 [Pseudonocardiaceae bacterium]|nr:hypothetical protein [Pseudonocardiaceae bacterium]
MTAYLTYGTTTHTVSELAQLITERTGITFIGHDSHYLGEYEAADISTGRIKIQPNAIPGDDGDGDLYAPEHSDVQTLLLITTSDPASDLITQLGSMDGLHPLAEPAT